MGIGKRETHAIQGNLSAHGLTIDDLLLKMDRMLSENRVSVLDNVFTDHDAEHNERLERAGYGVTLAIKEILPGIDVVKKHLENGTIRFNKNSLIEADTELVGKPQRFDRRTGCVCISATGQAKGHRTGRISCR